MHPAKTIEPSPARTADGPALTDEQVACWRERGFALVDGLFPAELIARARSDAARAFPEPGTAEAETIHDFGSGALEFPTSSDAFNALTLHPRLLGALSQLLGAEPADLRLTQSLVWPKYGHRERHGGEFDNDDQRIHVDYPNHTLTHPPPWEKPEAVELILYFGDVAQCGGATALVPRKGPDDPAYAWPITRTPGVAGLPWINDRATAEASLAQDAPAVAKWRGEHLYPHELRAQYRPGTVLLYRHDTWHRGTPLEPGALRVVHNMTFRRAESEWISVLQAGWSWAMYRRPAVMERLIATSSVEQRCVLGFPKPGHPYWTPETIAAVAARYGAYGMDMTPYASTPTGAPPPGPS